MCSKRGLKMQWWAIQQLIGNDPNLSVMSAALSTLMQRHHISYLTKLITVCQLRKFILMPILAVNSTSNWLFNYWWSLNDWTVWPNFDVCLGGVFLLCHQLILTTFTHLDDKRGAIFHAYYSAGLKTHAGIYFIIIIIIMIISILVVRGF